MLLPGLSLISGTFLNISFEFNRNDYWSYRRSFVFRVILFPRANRICQQKSACHVTETGPQPFVIFFWQSLQSLFNVKWIILWVLLHLLKKKNVLINKSKIVVTSNNCTTKANMALIPVIHPVDDIIKCTLDYTMHARYLNDNWMQVYTCHLQICGAWVQVKSMIEFESLILMLATYTQFPKF